MAKKIKTLLYVVLDSLRWDSFQKAKPTQLLKYSFGVEKRFSYATWTQPSHTCILAGLLPHQNHKNLAGQEYSASYELWDRLLGAPHQNFMPEFSLALAAQRAGWRTVSRVSMPVLNEATSFRTGFDDYSLSPAGGSLLTQLSSVRQSQEKTFFFVNAAETHYPYELHADRLPRVSGLHGVLTSKKKAQDLKMPFSKDELRYLQHSQVEAMKRAEKRLMEYFSALPKPIHFIVTSDHGELFGEEGFFGHGPYFHSKLFEVPFLQGIIR